MKLEISKSLRPPILFGWKIEDPDNEDLLGIIKLVESLGISFVVFDLNRLSPRLDSTAQGGTARGPDASVAANKTQNMFRNFVPIGRSDLALSTELWSTRVVSFIKTDSFESLKTQLDWSCYVAVRAVIIDLESVLTSQVLSENMDVLDRLVHFCQLISTYLRSPSLPTLWVSLDCCNQSWNTWYMIYELCNFSDKLKVCLKLLPLETEIGMWQSEPVKCVIISENSLTRTRARLRISREVVSHLAALLKNNVKVVFDSNLNFHQLYSQHTQGAQSAGGRAGEGANPSEPGVNLGGNQPKDLINSQIVNFNSTVSSLSSLPNVELNRTGTRKEEVGRNSAGLDLVGGNSGSHASEAVPSTLKTEASATLGPEHPTAHSVFNAPGGNRSVVGGLGVTSVGGMGPEETRGMGAGVSVHNQAQGARGAGFEHANSGGLEPGAYGDKSGAGNGDMALDEEVCVRQLLKAVKKIYAKLGPLSVNELYGRGYEDVLQVPLQPLRDNLDSNTYNEFEKCTFKYYSYHMAIDAFLKWCLARRVQPPNTFTASITQAAKGARIARGRAWHYAAAAHNANSAPHNASGASGAKYKAGEGRDQELAFDVYVVGAGRGPLVEVALEVFKKHNLTNFTVYAIDKNPYTMLTLQDKMARNGWTNVKLMCSDMRRPLSTHGDPEASGTSSTEVAAGANRDASAGGAGGARGGAGREILVVSELLGPFGDNELSPECLYGFERNFNPGDRLHFVPQSYTSYVMPLHAPQIWAKVKNLGSFKNFHMPYTVHLRSFYGVAHEYLPCFKFSHPSSLFPSAFEGAGRGDRGAPREPDEDKLDRYRVLKFVASGDCYVHGFGAYFRCTLFDRVHLSILPHESENIKSWFPMFFPLEAPFPVKKSQTITFHIWRKTDDLRVWYEWAFTTPATTSIHNVGGFAYHISKQ